MTFEVVIIVFAVLAVIAVAGWVLAYVKSKGVNVQGGVDTAQKVIGVADTVTDALAAVAPNTVTTTLQKIVDGAKLAVDSAEQMYLNGNVTADQRKETATNVLKQALALDGIAYEGDVSALGDAAMEAAVRALPSTGEALAAKAGTARVHDGMVGEGVGFERIRRITGYLVGTMDRWNNAKRAEERDRVKHGIGHKI